MKFDNAQIADRIDGDIDLAEAVGIYPGVQTVWVCGSTATGTAIPIKCCQLTRSVAGSCRLR